MTDDNKQQLNILLDRLDKLPPQLKDAIFSDVNAEKMFDIGKRHGLLIDKVGEMTNETGLLMFGITHPDEFVGNLAERLKVDRPTASKIADDINREIFAPVREHLRGMFGGTPQKEILEVRLPETGRLTSKISKPSPSETGLDSRLRGNDKVATDATLEDLEAELERALVEEKGIQPLSVVKKPSVAPPPIKPLQSTYKGADPYREQAGEDLPNIRGKAYAPTAQRQVFGSLQKTNVPTSPKNEQVSRVQPTPKPVEENSPFSPSGGQTQKKPTEQASRPTKLGEARPEGEAGSKTDPYHEPAKPTGTLSPFRGFRMNNDQNEEKKDNQKESIM